MIRFHISALVVFALTCGSYAETPTERYIRLTHCLVSLIEDVEVPAEKAGVLKTLQVREGDYLERDAAVAVIDDRQAKRILESARADYEAAQIKAENQLAIEYAEATHRTAAAELKIAESANKALAKTVGAVEVEKLRLSSEQARLEIGVKRMEREIFDGEAQSLAAKLKLAEGDLERHLIAAPIAGEVVEVLCDRGEWIEPGETVIRLVRLDRLRVEGFVRFADYAPAAVLGRSVRVTIATSDGRATFDGAVTFVSPLVQPGGEYRVWAEVDNRRVQKQWLLRPGLITEMSISLKPVSN